MLQHDCFTTSDSITGQSNRTDATRVLQMWQLFLRCCTQRRLSVTAPRREQAVSPAKLVGRRGTFGFATGTCSRRLSPIDGRREISASEQKMDAILRASTMTSFQPQLLEGPADPAQHRQGAKSLHGFPLRCLAAAYRPYRPRRHPRRSATDAGGPPSTCFRAVGLFPKHLWIPRSSSSARAAAPSSFFEYFAVAPGAAVRPPHRAAPPYAPLPSRTAARTTQDSGGLAPGPNQERLLLPWHLVSSCDTGEHDSPDWCAPLPRSPRLAAPASSRCNAACRRCAVAKPTRQHPVSLLQPRYASARDVRSGVGVIPLPTATRLTGLVSLGSGRLELCDLGRGLLRSLLRGLFDSARARELGLELRGRSAS
eukprot:scaffold442_cov268-Pinguiococcus_pyrenoidosus.AAC.88